MGIALLALSGLFQGLSSFNRAAPAAFTPKAPITPLATRPAARRLRPVWTTRHTTCAPVGQRPAHPNLTANVGANVAATAGASMAAPPALRVLRVTESDHRVPGAGRMVISGRMADVCAELDRLAALEAAQARH